MGKKGGNGEGIWLHGKWPRAACSWFRCAQSSVSEVTSLGWCCPLFGIQAESLLRSKAWCWQDAQKEEGERRKKVDGLLFCLFSSLDASEMIEMQGFGANLLSWQLEHCSQGSSCVSCSTGSSPYDVPSCCNCIHDRWAGCAELPCETLCMPQLKARMFYWLQHQRRRVTFFK